MTDRHDPKLPHIRELAKTNGEALFKAFPEATDIEFAVIAFVKTPQNPSGDTHVFSTLDTPATQALIAVGGLLTLSQNHCEPDQQKP